MSPHIRDFRKAPKALESLMLPLEKSGQSDSVNVHHADKRVRDLLSTKEYSAAQQEFKKRPIETNFSCFTARGAS